MDEGRALVSLGKCQVLVLHSYSAARGGGRGQTLKSSWDNGSERERDDIRKHRKDVSLTFRVKSSHCGHCHTEGTVRFFIPSSTRRWRDDSLIKVKGIKS